MKINEKINSLRLREDTKESVLYSFEYFAPRTQLGMENLYERIERMSVINPLWVDITWRAGKNAFLSLELAQHIQMFTGLDVMLHLTCVDMSKNDIDDVLNKCQKYGIRNILALRGDKPEKPEEVEETDDDDYDFEYAIDLIKYIRK